MELLGSEAAKSNPQSRVFSVATLSAPLGGPCPAQGTMRAFCLACISKLWHLYGQRMVRQNTNAWSGSTRHMSNAMQDASS